MTHTNGVAHRYLEDFTGEDFNVMFRPETDRRVQAFYERWTKQERWDVLFKRKIQEYGKDVRIAA